RRSYGSGSGVWSIHIHWERKMRREGKCLAETLSIAVEFAASDVELLRARIVVSAAAVPAGTRNPKTSLRCCRQRNDTEFGGVGKLNVLQVCRLVVGSAEIMICDISK